MGEVRDEMRWVRCKDPRGNEIGEVRDVMRWVRYEM